MTPTFSNTDSSESGTSACLPVESVPGDRSVHDVPDLSAQALAKLSVPILYLPPRLSSLPDNILPDTSIDHQTANRLPHIDPASLSLHKSLHRFRPLTSDYASMTYADAFNWAEMSLPAEEEREWYCVVFRSRRKPGNDEDFSALYEADRLAHEEAVHNGGLIMYWFGKPHRETRMNMATCIWQSRKHAVAANSRPHHIRAMKLASKFYEVYGLERYCLQKHKGETGIVVKAYTGGEVGW
ncbi:hypothetical protein AGABI1DRAFT_112645 [Agaricus bisporus var. burnettii JB137-S8]|uniref:Uncharacterized protein n=1 Tax=Agaricus bisporus var. burnettii (strain JB137-S8 / ATCC MYA-4627 / FGSC 10392) TaxID=597362 RepID=K5WZH9_AGABU|nr:uncharacterized protein AGABI1DRAFT_112645 [Agaricus bisporus var. burnettii JB137-S8]EKM80941.1 hypothetical protein AGABI1DRAFT_112645 [Agaricus bisporus var. burnettii JB137-S8]